MTAPITPRLLGHEPSVIQDPWAFVECYVPQEDRFHAASRTAWGVPGKSSAADVKKAGLWSHSECRLACPCAAATVAPTCAWEQPPACSPEFEYKGTMYEGCTSVEHDTPWCMHHHHHVEGQSSSTDWSNCQYTCDTDKDTPNVDPVTNSNCGWRPPASCVEEFNYEGTLFMGCTSTDFHSPWCSDKPIYDGSWNHCQYQCDNPTAADLNTIAELNAWAESEQDLCSWQAPTACASKFTYNGMEYQGCAHGAAEDTPWCSHDAVYVEGYSFCERVCTAADSSRSWN